MRPLLVPEDRRRLMRIRPSDPFARVTQLLGVRPQVHLHADDLPSTHTFSAWPGRRGSINASGIGNPYSAKAGWSGRGAASMRAAHLWPSVGQYIAFTAEAVNYSAATPFTWVLAAKIADTAAHRNVLGLGASSTSNNWRGLYLDPNDQIGLLSNRSGTTDVDTSTTPAFLAGQSIIIVSLSAAGQLYIWQRSAENGTVELLN